MKTTITKEMLRKIDQGVRRREAIAGGAWNLHKNRVHRDAKDYNRQKFKRDLGEEQI